MYGSVRTVVWQGSVGDRRPYADLTDNSDVTRLGKGCRPSIHNRFAHLASANLGAQCTFGVEARAEPIGSFLVPLPPLIRDKNRMR